MKHIEHFIELTKCSIENPVLLIADNHESHISLTASLVWRKHGIVTLTTHPHGIVTSTIHPAQLKSLERTVYGHLRKNRLDKKKVKTRSFSKRKQQKSLSTKKALNKLKTSRLPSSFEESGCEMSLLESDSDISGNVYNQHYICCICEDSWTNSKSRENECKVFALHASSAALQERALAHPMNAPAGHILTA